MGGSSSDEAATVRGRLRPVNRAGAPPGAERATLYWTVVSGPLFVSVNGRRVEIDGSCSVRHLLERCHAGDGPCAVEVNEELVPWSDHEHRRLQGGDRIEIVTLVGASAL